MTEKPPLTVVPNPTPPQSSVIKWVFYLIFLFIFVVFFLSCVGAVRKNGTEVTSDDLMNAEKAKEALRDRMYDPDSAKFRYLHAAKAAEDKRVNTICGDVLAKNGFGAYIGWHTFVYVVNTDTLLGPAVEGEMAVDDLRALTKRYCRRDIKPLS